MVLVEYISPLWTGTVKYRLSNWDIEVTYSSIGDTYDLTREEAEHLLTEYPSNFRRTVWTTNPLNKYTETVTLTANTPQTITHNLTTNDVVVNVYDTATWEEVFVDEDRNTANTNSIILISSLTVTVLVIVIG